jgi:hypothetical protein
VCFDFCTRKISLYAMTNRLKLLLPAQCSLFGRLVMIITETYLYRTGHTQKKGPPEGWNADQTEFVIHLSGNTEVYHKKLSSAGPQTELLQNDLFTGDMHFRREAEIILQDFGKLPKPAVEQETQDFHQEGLQLVNRLAENTIVVDPQMGSTIQELHAVFARDKEELETFKEQLTYLNVFSEGHDKDIYKVERTCILIARPVRFGTQLDTTTWIRMEDDKWRRFLETNLQKILR